jgi:hypothetical protein
MKKLILLSLLVACSNPVDIVAHSHGAPLLQPSDKDSPVAQFTIDCEGVICLFDAIDSKPTKLPIKAYGWEFGDASIRVMPGDIPSVQHTYLEKGKYTVGLVVWDALDRGGRIYKEIEIK